MSSCVKTISVVEFKQLCDSKSDACLIDVREPMECHQQRISGVTNIPKDLLIDRIQTMVSDHLRPIYLHCRAGVRSYDAALKLIQHGYENVYSVDGGLNAWIQAGYEVETLS